jgi:hypothetical protein
MLLENIGFSRMIAHTRPKSCSESSPAAAWSIALPDMYPSI